MEKPTLLEKTTGSWPTTIVTTLIGASTGNPLVALIPALTSTLAHERHKERVQKAIHELEEHLSSIEEQLHNITDYQYKLINETIVTVFRTVEDEKIEFLKLIINNTINFNKIVPFEAQILSRIIRDISAQELDFIVNNENYQWISFASPREKSNTLYVDKDSNNGAIVIGLINLGLITRSPSEGLASDAGEYSYSSIVPLLRQLLQVSN